MAFRPDIVIMSPDSPRMLLVIEAKTSRADPGISAEQLKAYMASMNVPTGVLVTPERFQIYRHTYSAHSSDAVTLIADVPVVHVLGISPAQVRETELEELVQRWLEGLQARTEHIPADVQYLIEENILPALDSGVIRAAGPRRRRIAS